MDHFKKLSVEDYEEFQREAREDSLALSNEEVSGYHNKSNFSSLTGASFLDIKE